MVYYSAKKLEMNYFILGIWTPNEHEIGTVQPGPYEDHFKWTEKTEKSNLATKIRQQKSATNHVVIAFVLADRNELLIKVILGKIVVVQIATWTSIY